LSNKLIFLTILILSILPIYGENIVGTMSGQITLENGEDTSLVEVGLEDLASADYLYDNPFVQGVELIFEQPTITQNFRNSFALYLYRAVQPVPDTSISHYKGNQFVMQILPYTSEFSVKIPFTQDHTIRKEADSVVTAPVSKDDFPLILTMLPISKGLPTQAKNAVITMKARPLYMNMGGLKIFIEEGEDILIENTEIRIDGNVVEWPNNYYPLEPGFHTINIINRTSGNREFNIAIEAGRFTEIHHTLEAALPQLIFAPSEGVKYYLDGVEIPEKDLGQSLSCEPGSHVISIMVNDHTTLTEDYIVSAGEIINISLEARILLEKD
jgi:hypothetical protein